MGPPPDDPLAPFHPLVAAWFGERIGAPTEVQRLAWPRIAEGAHLLASAPTGSGKTLAALLWAVDRLLTRAWEPGAIRVLYVSPLRALNNDLRRNLLVPLAELTARFEAAGGDPPRLGVVTRSGDTPPDERRRMLRHPPEILITTPESLNLLLTARTSRVLLDALETVILDEIHAVAGTKRGTHLITAVERLASLSGEFQRIALSATVAPKQRIAAWIGGWELLTPAVGNEEPHYRRRPVEIVEATPERRYDLSVTYRAPGAADGESSAWPGIVAEVRRSLGQNRSTLVFCNSRRTVEKLTRLVNEAEGSQRVWAHHGSLAREVREVVEERLKRGELAGIVATSSLELGIDIGALDEVLLVSTPTSIASAAQRIGRAGHRVGGIGRGRFLPLHAKDLLDAAVMVRAVEEGEVEPLSPLDGPLDVLAQVIVSMTAGETWDIPELLAVLRCAEPYHGLTRRQLDGVLEMLDGKHRGRPVPELRPLVSLDAVEGTVRARAGADRALYRGGGTIPDRGYYHLRRAGSGSKIGELDEEFVWERRLGDQFTLGVQSWRIESITHNDVLVEPAGGPGAMPPFWRADDRDRGAFLSERIAHFLEEAEAHLDDPALREQLVNQSHLTEGAAAALIELLRAQRHATGVLPHRRRIVAERSLEGAPGGEGGGLVLHTFWGGRINRPFAIALQGAWRRRGGTHLEATIDDDAVGFAAPEGVRARDLVSMLEPEEIEQSLREELGATGFFGARFREAAGTALQLPRQGFGRRTPLWVSRQRARQLLDRVGHLPEFPLLLEAWRSALVDHFDLPRLRELLDELRAGRIALVEVTTRVPSPFAAEATWKRTNELMYRDDTPASRAAAPSAGLLRELVHAGSLRPKIPRALAEEFERKSQRLWPGYAPRGASELLDWLRERIVVPPGEWDALLEAASEASEDPPGHLLAAIGKKLAGVAFSVDEPPRFVAALEALPRLSAALGRTPRELTLVPLVPAVSETVLRRTLSRLARTALIEEADPLAELLADLLRYHGPVSPRRLAEPLGVPDAALRDALETLESSGRAVIDAVTDDAAEPQLCDADNLERLLRRVQRARRRPFEALSPARLPSFLAAWQGIAGREGGAAALARLVEQLAGLPLPAALWESDVLPVRVEGYLPGQLDELLAAGEVEWLGAGEKKIALLPAGEGELFVDADAERVSTARARLLELFPDVAGRYPLEALAARSGSTTGETTRRLWALAWDGLATTDSFAPVRAGLAAGFAPAEPHRVEAPGPRGAGRGGRRLRFAAWRTTRAFGGAWSPLFPCDPPADALERDELERARARVLLQRYGVVFRELTARELPPLAWGRLFRALRLLELSGEAVAGQFFEGSSGVQFALPEAIETLSGLREEGPPFFLSAADPASVCGLGLPGLPAGLPRRLPTNHAAFAGARLVAATERRGRALSIFAERDDPALEAALGLLRFLLGQRVRTPSVVVETINGERAAESPWEPLLAGAFHVSRDGGALRLRGRAP